MKKVIEFLMWIPVWMMLVLLLMDPGYGRTIAMIVDGLICLMEYGYVCYVN